MGILNNVLFWINIVRLIFILGSFFFQLLFGCLLFLKPRKYKKAEKYHDFTIIIRARNEAEVIADAVDSCRKLDYPKDSPYTVQGRNNKISPNESYTQEKHDKLYKANCEWFRKELLYLQNK